MGRILVRLDLLSSLRGILWVPHRQAPEHFMIELQGPGCCRLVPGSFLKRDLEMVFFVFSSADVHFWTKVHSVSVAPEPLACWDKKPEGPFSLLVCSEFFFLQKLEGPDSCLQKISWGYVYRLQILVFKKFLGVMYPTAPEPSPSTFL